MHISDNKFNLFNITRNFRAYSYINSNYIIFCLVIKKQSPINIAINN